jgi:AcrR family transcriptional regulator
MCNKMRAEAHIRQLAFVAAEGGTPMPAKARTTPRKLPRQARSRETIEAILTATARVLKRVGFDHASTNHIAEEAGVSVGSLYQYFPSKEALVAALLERHMAEMSAELMSGFQEVAELPLERAARAMVERMLCAHAVDPDLHKVLIEQVPRVGRLERVHELEEHGFQLVRAYLEAHRKEVRACDLDTAAFVAVTAVEALTHIAVLYRPAALKGSQLADEVTALIVRYLER